MDEQLKNAFSFYPSVVSGSPQGTGGPNFIFWLIQTLDLAQNAKVVVIEAAFSEQYAAAQLESGDTFSGSERPDCELAYSFYLKAVEQGLASATRSVKETAWLLFDRSPYAPRIEMPNADFNTRLHPYSSTRSLSALRI